MAGVAVAQDCVDLGAGPGDDVWRTLSFLPSPDRLGGAAPRAASSSVEAQRMLERLQFPGAGAAGCGAITHPVGALPIIGFGQALEYLLLSLATSAAQGAQLVLGRSSSGECEAERLEAQ